MNPFPRIHAITTVAEAQAAADGLQAQINALEDRHEAAFGPAVQALDAETAEACKFPTETGQ